MSLFEETEKDYQAQRKNKTQQKANEFELVHH